MSNHIMEALIHYTGFLPYRIKSKEWVVELLLLGVMLESEENGVTEP